ncbi:hypothetical protein [Mycobacteroides abscessus]|uniref:hypothetical protein n=1 Tax=Mycobacteroides abscessus TaxID=36809 RepID=UPI0019254B21|nr:hypothetical protein [Mycobacteroides abscessus]MBL3752034.1 hypothetical protein [Mycobacteroides abscessus subsp. massiliense]
MICADHCTAEALPGLTVCAQHRKERLERVAIAKGIKPKKPGRRTTGEPRQFIRKSTGLVPGDIPRDISQDVPRDIPGDTERNHR